MPKLKNILPSSLSLIVPIPQMTKDPIYNIIWFILLEYGILLGGLSDCEELVGVTHRRS